MRNRYSGNSQAAVARCRSSPISTTVTWNWRGRQMTAAPDRKQSVTQRGPNTSPARSMPAGMCEKTSAGPPTTPITTTPTTIMASSLTTASTAIAATTPWWRSLASMLRVPKRMVNTAMPTAIQNASWKLGCALYRPASAAGPDPLTTWKLVVTALSCSAIYGVDAATTMSVTSAARTALVP